MSNNKVHRSGFVAIVGRPNAGKSTLLNNLLGKKVAIVSDKPQTTRNKISGVLTRENFQSVFLDTPGIHKPKHKLSEYMLEVTESTLKEVDLIFYVVDASVEFGRGERYILEKLSGISTPCFLVLNKTDLVSEEKLFSLTDKLRELHTFSEIVPVSALTGYNLTLLTELLKEHLPEGPRYFPPEMITDRPEQFLISELIREKALLLTREEVPHSLAVKIDAFEERREGNVYIAASIYVERDSQKGILIGKRGSMLKNIGSLARADIENLLNCKVFLDLRVKVRKNWRKKQYDVTIMGYDRSCET